jgi:Domain of unknown function (DUF4365)
MNSPKKIVPKSKTSEWRGLDRISTIVHGMNCIWREQEKDDVGVEGEIELCQPRDDGDDLVATGKVVEVQSKSGKSYIVKDEESSFASPVEEKDLRYWQGLNVPVIYVVYHPKDDALYWKDVKAYIASYPDAFEPPLRIEFDKSADRFDASAYPALCSICASAPERVATNVAETLYTNFLEVEKLPKQVYVASVLPEKRSHFHQRLTGRIPPYVYKSGTVITLIAPREPETAITTVVEGEAEEIGLDEWLIQDSQADSKLRTLLNSLLHRPFRSIGLTYQNKPRCYFFNEGLAEDAPLHRKWKSARTERVYTRLVAKHYEYGKSLKFYRHSALDAHFERFGDRWAIVLHPRLHFTVDGQNAWEGKVARSYAIRARAQEFNAAYLNNVLFWAYELSRGQLSFELQLYGITVARVSGVPLTVEAGFGIRSPGR